jgi:TPR repeat protein
MRVLLLLLAAILAPCVDAQAERQSIEQFLADGGVQADPARFVEVFEQAYVSYFVRAKGQITDSDRALIKKASASLDPKALHRELVDLYVEELSHDEVALATQYYRLQVPREIRNDKEAVLRWAESLRPEQKATIDGYKNSEVGRSLQSKVLKVTLVLMSQATARLMTALDFPDKDSGLHFMSKECDKLFAEGDAFKILMTCSMAASVPCPSCELHLGRVYMSGALFPPDLPRAMKHFRSAARLSSSEAQGVYGRLLVRQDYPPAGTALEGVHWIMLSAANGYKPAQEELKWMRVDKPADMAKAEASYRAFLATNGVAH